MRFNICIIALLVILSISTFAAGKNGGSEAGTGNAPAFGECTLKKETSKSSCELNNTCPPKANIPLIKTEAECSALGGKWVEIGNKSKH